MDASTIFLSLGLVVPTSTLAWLALLSRGSKPLLISGSLWGLLVLSVVPLGGLLAALVALAFGEPLQMAPFSWVARPVYSLGVIAASALVGGFFSLGVASALSRMLAGKGVEASVRAPASPAQL